MKIDKLWLMVWLKKNKALAVILTLVFLLRLPSFFEPFVYGDEGIYLTLGQAMRRGWVLYRDIHDNKPPLLYLLAAASANFTYFRILLMAWSLLTVGVFSRLANQLFQRQPKATILATFLFAILTSVRLFEGNVANAENFMLLPTLTGFWLLVKNLKSKKPLPFFLAGTLFGLAVLFKVPAAFDFPAALIFLFLLSFKRKEKLYAIRQTLYAIIGFLLPFLITFIYFYCQRAFVQYWTAAFQQNIPYLSSWQTQSHRQFSPFRSGLFLRGLLLLAASSLMIIKRKKFSRPLFLISLWFIFSFFAALLSARPYPHYLLQVVPSLSLAFGLILSRSWEKYLSFFLTAMLIFVFLAFHFWHYPSLSYYLNFGQFVQGAKSKTDYFRFFGWQTEMVYQLADYIRSRTQSEEAVFIWGDQPAVYALSRRPPVGRYTVKYHIIDFNGYTETMAALRQAPPRLVVIIGDVEKEFSELAFFLKKYYFKNHSIGESEIYWLRERPS